ncbi:MAG: DEAD/DEAH box helicase [Deltaproteobacteria bacterium]|nr:DEAD/DEAH box helicase [Deltaproteobacteria bacterium]
MLGLPPVFARPLQARTRGSRAPRAQQRPREGGRPPHTGAEGPAPQLGSGAPSARVRRPASPRALRERRRRTVADGIPGSHARCRHARGRLEAPSLHQPSAPRAGRRGARRRPRGASPARRGTRAPPVVAREKPRSAAPRSASRASAESSIRIRSKGSSAFSPAGACCSPTTWGSARPRRPSPRATRSTGRARERGILIVPASLKPQWKREWDATTSVSLMRVDGSPEERNRIYADTRSGFLVIGYEQLLRDLEGVRRFAPDIVVLDEAQRIKNWATKSAAYVKSLDAPYRLVLTGTPMENRFDELASIMDFVDDVALEPKWRLAPLHQLDRGDGASGRGGARNLDLLRGRLAGSMLRRVRHDVLSQLPPRTDKMTPAQVERHDELLQPIAQIVHRSLRRPLSQPEFLKLMSMLTMQRILCNGVAQADFDDHWPRIQPEARPTPALLEGMFAPKLATLRGLVEQVVLGQRRKTVIFSQWRAMLRLAEWSVRDLLADAGMRAVFFTGAESSRLREHAIVDFHDDPAVTVMFLSDAGGVGLNLQHAASCCINLEVPWNPAMLEQRIGRIYRLGQSKPIDVYNLVSEEGIEARIATLVAQKRAVFSSLFDGTTDEVRFEGSASFLESVRKIVEPIDVPVGDAETEPEGTAAEVAAEAAAAPTARPRPRRKYPRSRRRGVRRSPRRG